MPVFKPWIHPLYIFVLGVSILPLCDLIKIIAVPTHILLLFFILLQNWRKTYLRPLTMIHIFDSLLKHNFVTIMLISSFLSENLNCTVVTRIYYFMSFSDWISLRKICCHHHDLANRYGISVPQTTTGIFRLCWSQSLSWSHSWLITVFVTRVPLVAQEMRTLWSTRDLSCFYRYYWSSCCSFSKLKGVSFFSFMLWCTIWFQYKTMLYTSFLVFVLFVLPGVPFFSIYVNDFIYKHACQWTISMYNGVRVFQQ